MTRRRPGREAILDAAATVMAERGYHGTSVRDIAAASGITVASLYHHFQSKQDILTAIMERALDEAYRITGAAAATGGTPAGRLAAAMAAWVSFHVARREEAVIGATEVRGLEPARRERILARRDAQERLFRDLIAEGVRAGAFRTPYPDDAARSIMVMGNSVATWFSPPGPLTPAQLAARYAALALALVESV